MEITQKDKDILRQLGEKVAKIAALPVHQEKIKMWKLVNSLKKTKPMLWINEEPWHELNVNDELTLKTSNDFCREVENRLRMIIYSWEHMKVDMIVEPVVYSPVVYNNTGFGISEDVEIVKTDEKSGVVSRHFHRQIENEEDIEKIKMPVVTLDPAVTERNFQLMKDIFSGILNVEKQGVRMIWFAPWDELIRWWGVQDAMLDLVLRPELVHKAMDRLVTAYLHMLDQLEKLDLLCLNNGNYRIGSGALGYIDELPQKDYNSSHVRTKDTWGCATAQIFSEVSPAMHEEFALNYEIRWMKRFGLNYYGCCEPLHNKMEILKKVPNLRKISMSRWIDLDKAVKLMGDKYVFSYKPNPSIFAGDSFNLEAGKQELVNMLNKTGDAGCKVEIIMKDISTVSYKPQRLWEWAKMAEEVTAKYS
jgi:hypothetical protein